MMRPGLLALVAASGFSGATLYINLVEQPARLAVGGRAMMREWVPSNRRGVVMLSILAVASALLGYGEFSRTGDVRWLVGGTVILASLPYTFFVMVPANIWLAGVPASGQAIARRLMNDWGLLEWAQTAIGLCSCAILGWALTLPA